MRAVHVMLFENAWAVCERGYVFENACAVCVTLFEIMVLKTRNAWVRCVLYHSVRVGFYAVLVFWLGVQMVFWLGLAVLVFLRCLVLQRKSRRVPQRPRRLLRCLGLAT